MSREAVQIGLVEDDGVMGESLVQRLELEGFAVDWWKSGEEALSSLSNGTRPDLMVCDIRLPGLSGEDLYGAVTRSTEPLPFLFITAFADLDQAVRLMRSGAGDYVAKPFRMDDFLGRIEQLVRSPADSEQRCELGPSPEMQSICDLLARLAGNQSPVLFTGETGVGKEVCARFLHDCAGGDEPFMAVNCAAIPGDLLESELFGHERGAFTGAGQRHLGYAERARGGTLFLDEIGELPTGLQAKLLRLIEERCFHRLGGESVIGFRGRIVSATNRPLEEAVAAGRFREDLLYRINTLTIDIPPLRERPLDIVWLASRLLRQASGLRKKGPVRLTDAAEEALLTHHWPGNARELRNRIERAVALAVDTAPFGIADLFPTRQSEARGGSGFKSLGEARIAAEKLQIERALETSDGQIAAAARLLRISRTTLWQKMRRLGLSSGSEGRGLDS